MYCEALQRSHVPPEPCDLPRSVLTQMVKGVGMEKRMSVKWLKVWLAVNCRF